MKSTCVGRRLSIGIGTAAMGLATLGLVLPVIALEGGHLATAPSDSRIKPELLVEMGAVPADQLIPVTIVMLERAEPNEIAEAKQIRDKQTRRQAVIGLLKDVAIRSQEDVLAELAAGQAAGSVGALIRPLWIDNVIGADVTADMVRAIAQRDDVLHINFDKPLGPEVFPVEPAGEPPAQAAIECGVNVMQAPRVWNELGITGRGAVVCSIDTGCCITHPDLRNQIWVNEGEIPGNNMDDDGNGYIDDVNGWNFWQRNGDITDTNGHGTHVAGTVVGDGTNGEQTGMAPDAEIMNARYFVSFSGESTIWESMEYAVDNGAHAITVSSGWPHSQNPDRRTWREVCEASIAAGVVVIYAAGNEGGGNPPDNVRTPGDVPAVITIGATDCNDNIASFSSRGPVTWQNIDPWRDWPYPPGKIKPTVSAPGVNTLSTSSNCSGYRSLSGTSMATPHVAGAVALMLEGNPNLDHDQVKQILMDTSIDLGAEGMDNNYGAGRVDAYAAVLAAIALNDRFPADSFEVTRGALASGGVEDLASADDSYVQVSARRPDEVAAASVEIEVTGHVDLAAPSELVFTFEGATSGTPARQRIELFNYATDSWVQHDERDGPTDDAPVTVSINVNADDYVDAGTLEVKARIGYHDRGVNFLNWGGRYDATFWQTVE
jgi:serine protease AprX